MFISIHTASAYFRGTFTAVNAPAIHQILSIYSGHSDHRDKLEPIASIDIKNKQVILRDISNTNIIEHFPEVVSYIHTALSQNSPVLVHCHKGISRSATAVLAYLIWAQCLPLKAALELLRSKRPVVKPNLGFIRQLELWEQLECDLLTNAIEYHEKEEYTNFQQELKLKRFENSDDRAPDLGALRLVQRPVATDKPGSEMAGEDDKPGTLRKVGAVVKALLDQ